MLLTFPQRASTRDVDAVIGADQPWLRRTAAELAAGLDWPSAWLNDGAKAGGAPPIMLPAPRQSSGATRARIGQVFASSSPRLIACSP